MLDAEVDQATLERGIQDLKHRLAGTSPATDGPLDYAGRIPQIPNEVYQEFQMRLASKQLALEGLGKRVSHAVEIR